MVVDVDYIKSKPVKYHKSFFRSHTEARWATFFDALWFSYRYEPAKVFLEEKAKSYVPDFRVSSYVASLAIEIKGTKPTEFEREKCEVLCGQERVSVLLLHGNPWPDDYEGELFYTQYDYLTCDWCGRLLPKSDPYCPDCNNNWQMVTPYEPSARVASKPARFSETTEGDVDNIFLSNVYLASLLARPLESNLYFGFQLASRAQYFYLQNYTPKLYQGNSFPFSPAFQTQDWNEAELMYNALPWVLTLDEAKYLVGCGMGPLELREWFGMCYFAQQKNKWLELCNSFADSLTSLISVLKGYIELFPNDDMPDRYVSDLSIWVDHLLELRYCKKPGFEEAMNVTYYALFGLAYENIMMGYSLA